MQVFFKKTHNISHCLVCALFSGACKLNQCIFYVFFFVSVFCSFFLPAKFLRGVRFFLAVRKWTLQQTPPPQGLPVCSFEKPLQASYGRGAIRENPGYRDFKKIFTAEFGHFLVTIFFYKFFSKKIIKKKTSHQKVTKLFSKKKPVGQLGLLEEHLYHLIVVHIVTRT